MVDKDESSGELSEVASRKAAGPTTPGDAVAGHPFDDDVQEGAAGPNARTGNQDAAEEYRITEGDPEAVVDEEDTDVEAVVDEHDAPPADEDDDAYPRVQDVEEDRA